MHDSISQDPEAPGRRPARSDSLARRQASSTFYVEILRTLWRELRVFARERKVALHDGRVTPTRHEVDIIRAERVDASVAIVDACGCP